MMEKEMTVKRRKKKEMESHYASLYSKIQFLITTENLS